MVPMFILRRGRRILTENFGAVICRPLSGVESGMSPQSLMPVQTRRQIRCAILQLHDTAMSRTDRRR